MGENTELLIEKSQKGTITTQIQLEEKLPAPVSQGQSLGTMIIKSGEQVLKAIPLVAARNVDRLTFGEIYLSVLRQAAMAQTL